MDRGYSFHCKVMWWVIIAVCMALMLRYLTGCGFNSAFGEKMSTRVIGAQVNVSDQFKDQKGGEVRADRGTIIEVTSPAVVPVVTPTTHPTPVALETPVQVALGDKSITAPPGSTVRIAMANAVESVPTVVEHNRQAIAQGASLQSRDPSTGNFDASAPTVSLTGTKGQGGGAKASGGGVGFSWENILPEASPLAWAIGITGLVIIVVAGFLWFFNKSNIKTPLIVAAFGFLLICFAVVVDKYPWALLAVLLLAAILWAVWWYSKQEHTTLNELIWTVEKASPSTQAEIKAAMKDSPKSSVVKKVVTNIKES